MRNSAATEDAEMPVRVHPRSSTRELVWILVWGALFGGLLEFAARQVMYHVLGNLRLPVYGNPHAIWMAPLANLPLYALAVALVLFVVRKSADRVPMVMATVVALAVLETASLSHRLHYAAIILISVGIGVQAAALCRRRRGAAMRIVRLTAPAMLVLSVAGGIGIAGYQWLAERRASGRLHAPAGTPNILLLVLDTVRAIELGMYGYPVATTPHLDRIAVQGIRFDRAIATAPWTLPSHASLFTGRDAPELEVDWTEPLADREYTLAEHLAEAGYATGGFVANLTYTTRLFGLDQGFHHYSDYAFSISELAGSSNLLRRALHVATRELGLFEEPGRKRARTVNEEFLSWQRRQGDRPFFAFLNYYDAHDPYDPPAPFDTMFLGRQARYRFIEVDDPVTDERRMELQAAYDASIRYLDREIARLLDELNRRGVLDNTLVIITSDHGEAFLEHGHFGHAKSVYLPELHVPLIVLLPNRRAAGTVVHEPVSIRDVPATILDVAGVRQGVMPGTSLAPLWTSGRDDVSLRPARAIFARVSRLATPAPPHYPAVHGDLEALIADPWHYIREERGVERLFHFRADPMERTNLAADPAHADTVARLRAQLDSAASGGSADSTSAS